MRYFHLQKIETLTIRRLKHEWAIFLYSGWVCSPWAFMRTARTKTIRNRRSLDKSSKWHWETMVVRSSQSQTNYSGGLDTPHGLQVGNAWFRAESCEEIISSGFLTFSSHFLLVNDEDVLKDTSHSARCHEMGAVVIDEFCIHAIVVGVRKLPQGEQHVFIQNDFVPSHLETGCLHLCHTSNESNLLQVKKRGAATQHSVKKKKSHF